MALFINMVHDMTRVLGPINRHFRMVVSLWTRLHPAFKPVWITLDPLPSADFVPPIGNLQPQSNGFVPIWSVTSTVLQLLNAFLRHPLMPVQVILLHCWGKLSQTLDHPLVGWTCLTVRLFWEPWNVAENGITCLQPLNTGFLPSLQSSRINTSAAFPMSRYI